MVKDAFFFHVRRERLGFVLLWWCVYGKGGTWLYSSRLSQEGVNLGVWWKLDPSIIALFMPNVTEEHLQETHLLVDMFTV